MTLLSTVITAATGSGQAGISGWDVLAAIGAFCGVPALGWQIYSQLHTWRAAAPDIRVKVASAVPVSLPTGAGGHYFRVAAANHGGSLAIINTWGFRLPTGSDLVLMRQLPFSDQLPATVQPQSAVAFYIEARDVLERCREQGVKANQLRPWVRLATGREIFGKTVPWRD